MPIIAYLYQLITSLLTAVWAFLSVWLEDFIFGFLVDYVLNMIIEFIKDELLIPVEVWAKGLIDEVTIEIKEKVNSAFIIINDLNDSLKFFACERFALDVNSLVNSINANLYTKISEYSGELIALINNLFNPILLLFDEIINLENELITATTNGQTIINNSIEEQLNTLAIDSINSITGLIYDLPIPETDKETFAANVNNSINNAIANKSASLIGLIDTTLTPVFSAMNSVNTNTVNARQTVQSKNDLITTGIQTKTTDLITAIHTAMTDLINNAVKEWLKLLCDTVTTTTNEIKESIKTQRDELLHLTDSANAQSKIIMGDIETVLVGKVVHQTIKPHIDQLNKTAKDKLDNEKTAFLQSDLTDLFDINEEVKAYKDELEANHDVIHSERYYKRTAKTFRRVDIHRFMVHYFSRDERVAFMLDILEHDLKINIDRILNNGK